MNYTIQRGAQRSNGVTKQVYFCRRSGLPRTIVNSGGKRKRREKSQGSYRQFILFYEVFN